MPAKSFSRHYYRRSSSLLSSLPHHTIAHVTTQGWTCQSRSHRCCQRGKMLVTQYCSRGLSRVVDNVITTTAAATPTPSHVSSMPTSTNPDDCNSSQAGPRNTSVGMIIWHCCDCRHVVAINPAVDVQIQPFEAWQLFPWMSGR